MAWIAYMPAALSIYLALVSGFSKTFLVNSVRNFVARREDLKVNGDVIANIALSWASRLNLFNAISASFAASLVIYSKTRSYEWLAGTIMVLLAILGPVAWWLFSLEPDELTTTRVKWVGITYANVCRVILVLVNVI